MNFIIEFLGINAGFISSRSLSILSLSFRKSSN